METWVLEYWQKKTYSIFVVNLKKSYETFDNLLCQTFVFNFSSKLLTQYFPLIFRKGYMKYSTILVRNVLQRLLAIPKQRNTLFGLWISMPTVIRPRVQRLPVSLWYFPIFPEKNWESQHMLELYIKTSMFLLTRNVCLKSTKSQVFVGKSQYGLKIYMFVCV